MAEQHTKEPYWEGFRERQAGRHARFRRSMQFGNTMLRNGTQEARCDVEGSGGAKGRGVSVAGRGSQRKVIGKRAHTDRARGEEADESWDSTTSRLYIHSSPMFGGRVLLRSTQAHGLTRSRITEGVTYSSDHSLTDLALPHRPLLWVHGCHHTSVMRRPDRGLTEVFGGRGPDTRQAACRLK